jgi:hypothetical protein
VLEYQERVLGRPSPVEGPPEAIVRRLRDSGSWIIGTPDDAIEALRSYEQRTGGYGGLMIMANEFASREKTLKSYELLARYVMPQFQGTLGSLERSLRAAEAQSTALREATVQAIEHEHRAFETTRV